MSCYNAERWLPEAIDSILQQTYEGYELILINDGSGDNTAKIIQAYAMRDSRIVTIDKPNSGLADSLNTGLDIARGDWIARIDADDLSEPTRFEEQLGFSRDHPAVVLLGSAGTEIDSYGRPVRRYTYPQTHAQLTRHLERCQRFFAHSSAFFRASQARSLSGYSLRFPRAEDRDLWLRLSQVGRLACLRSSLVRIRKHESQVSLHDHGEAQFRDAVAATVCHWVRKLGGQDPSLRAPEVWRSFTTFLEGRLSDAESFQRSTALSVVRSQARHRSRTARLPALIAASLSSAPARGAIRDRIFGSGLPKRLARDWINHG
jgi:glycosyltransferase involved in cell wall biosynthesis